MDEEVNVVEKMSGGKIFLLIWFLSIAVMYFLASRPGNPLVLPGDIYIQKEGFTLYFPIVSSILISIILTFLFNLFK